MRLTVICALALLLAACASTPTSNGGSPDDVGFTLNGVVHSRATAERFIIRKLAYEAGLVNYVDPRRAKLVTRELTGESVVFRLDNTGDRSEFHQATIERASELALALAWPDVMIDQEQDREGHLAYVRVESIGMPADVGRGTTLPVRIVCIGDATDIRGGYLYRTPVKNKLGRTIAVWEGGYLPAAGELPGQRDGKPVKNPLIDSRTGKQAIDPDTQEPQWEEALERRQSLGRATYILREGFKISTTVPSDELSAESIELPMDRIIDESENSYAYPVSADLVPELIRGIEEAMKAKGVACRVEAEGIKKLIVTPLGVREKSLQQVFDDLQTIKLEFVPRNHVIIVFDEELQRVVLYGPLSRRFLIDDVQLGTDPFTVGTFDPQTGKPRKPEELPFKVSCRVIQRAKPGKSGQYGVADEEGRAAHVKPDGDKGKVHLSWTLRDKDGSLINEGEEDLDSADIADILRHLWMRGMGPREVLGFCVVAKDKPALLAELGFNPRRVRIDENSDK